VNAKKLKIKCTSMDDQKSGKKITSQVALQKDQWINYFKDASLSLIGSCDKPGTMARFSDE